MSILTAFTDAAILRHRQKESFPATEIPRGRRPGVSRKLAMAGNRKYRPSEKQKPDAIVSGANKRLASRFYQLKTGHCLTGLYLQWTTRRPDMKCWWCQESIQTREHFPQWRCQQKTLWAAVLEENIYMSDGLQAT